MMSASGMDAFTLQKIFGWSDMEMARRYVESNEILIREVAKRTHPSDRLNL